MPFLFPSALYGSALTGIHGQSDQLAAKGYRVEPILVYLRGAMHILSGDALKCNLGQPLCKFLPETTHALPSRRGANHLPGGK